MEDKADMVRKVAFPPPAVDLVGPPPHREGTAHERIDEVRLRKALFDQSQK